MGFEYLRGLLTYLKTLILHLFDEGVAAKPCFFVSSIGDVRLTYFGQWTGLQHFSNSLLVKNHFVAPGTLLMF